MSKVNPTDLEKLQARDPEFLTQVVKQHTTHLYKACLGLGFANTEAEDLTQNVWITFLEIAPRFEGRSTLRTFLFGILYNKASELRKQNRRADPSIDIEKILDDKFNESGHWIQTPADPEKFLYSTQVAGLINQCLELLPLAQKMAFALKEVEEATTEEICHQLSVTATHLGVLLFRARNQLRICIESKT